MATNERRRSISLFFGFSKPEVRPDVTPGDFPKLRRKLQKVTKPIDIGASTAPAGFVPAQAPDGFVQTVKVPGDDSFLSTKYETRPPLSPSTNAVLAAADAKKAKEDKRARRDSKPGFFSRSSSASRVSNSSRSASCTRPPSTIATRPESSRGESTPGTAIATAATTTASATTITLAPVATAKSTPATTATTARSAPAANTGRIGGYDAAVINNDFHAAAEVQVTGDAQDRAMAQKKAAHAAAQARALRLMEAHERASAQEWASKRTSLSSAQASEIPVPRQYPQFHRPYNHSQHQSTLPPKEAGMRQTRSTANRSPYAPRKAVLAPVTIPSKPVTISPLSPVPSSATSEASSISLSSPTSATFTLSPASSFTQSYNTLPLSPPGSSASCANPPGDCVAGSFSYSREYKANKYDYNNYNRVVPELSHLSPAKNRCPPTPDSPVSTASDSSTVKTRRKVKTPVFAIGQLERNASSDEATNNERKRLSDVIRDGLDIQTPPESPVSSTVNLVNDREELSLLSSESSIECIAEGYRALLASRNSGSTDEHSECNEDVSQRPTSTNPRRRNSNKRNNSQARSPAPSPRKFMLSSANSSNAIPQIPMRSDARLSSPLLPADVFRERSPRASVPNPTASPLGANMALPPPPLRTRNIMLGINPGDHNSTANYEIPPPQPDNLSFQMCLDLLTRELSSAVAYRSSPAAAAAASQRAASRRQLQQHGMPGGVSNPQALAAPISASSLSSSTNPTVSALQILVMIEAYERLRDQLVADARQKNNGMIGSNHDVEGDEIESMFSLWLKALYRIHSSLTCSSTDDDESDGLDNTSDSEYDSAVESSTE